MKTGIKRPWCEADGLTCTTRGAVNPLPLMSLWRAEGLLLSLPFTAKLEEQAADDATRQQPCVS